MGILYNMLVGEMFPYSIDNKIRYDKYTTSDDAHICKAI